MELKILISSIGEQSKISILKVKWANPTHCHLTIDYMAMICGRKDLFIGPRGWDWKIRTEMHQKMGLCQNSKGSTTIPSSIADKKGQTLLYSPL